MMMDRQSVGKALLLVVSLVLILGSAALAVPENEQAWIALEQGHQDEAMQRSQTKPDALSRWIVAQIECVAGTQPSAMDSVSEASRAFCGRDFETAAEVLARLLDGNLNADDNLHLSLRYGACLVELGRIPEAEDTLTQAIDQARVQGRTASECYGLLTRGRARVRLRQVEPPRKDLTESLSLAKSLAAHQWSGVAAIALSVVSRLQMDLDDALTWRKEALLHFQEAGDLQGQARAQHYIAAIGIMQGDLSRAMTQLQDAHELARQAEDEGERGGILGEMAAINYLLGYFDKALDQYREAVRLAPNPWRRGMMLVNIGSIHEYRKELDAAVPVLEEALALMRQVGDHRTETQALQSLGEALCEMGQFDRGLAILDEAIATAKEYDIPMSEAYALEIKGQALLQKKDLAGAALAFDQSTALARQIEYFDILEWSLLGRSRVARQDGDSNQALQLLQEALTEVAAVRRRSGGSTQVSGSIVKQADGIYTEMIDLLFAMHQADNHAGYDQQAYSVAQGARARSFSDLMTEAEYDLNISAVPGYRGRESEILSRIIGLEGRLATAGPDSIGSLKSSLGAAEDELRNLEARLRDQDPRYAEVLYPEPLSSDSICRQVLRPEEVMLEYSLGEDRSFLWILTSEGIRMVALPGRQIVEEKVRNLLPLLQDYNLTGAEAVWYIEPARELHKLLVQPAAAEIAGSKRLIICADEILHYLPFEALLARDSKAATFGELPWLVDDLSLVYTPSATVLGRLRQKTQPNPHACNWLLVGDPVLVRGSDASLFARAAGAADLAPLPYAAEELESLARLAGSGSTVRVLSGPAATRGNLASAASAANLHLVHFASHGLFNEARPRYSGLVVSPDPATEDDGFLSISEVLALNLECDQVVLSACASALGPHVTGEGLVGLTGSFLFAGSRSVVSALWNVSGRETSAFMQKYYQELESQPGDRAECLATAKRAMIASQPSGGPDLAHPTFWSAFVFSGVGK